MGHLTTVVIQEAVKRLKIARVSDCTTAFQLLYQPTVVDQSVERTSCRRPWRNPVRAVTRPVLTPRELRPGEAAVLQVQILRYIHVHTRFQSRPIHVLQYLIHNVVLHRQPFRL